MNNKEKWDIPVTAKYCYSQDSDSCQSDQMSFQTLVVQIEDAGGGNYLVIRTKRWALDEDSIDRFCAMLKNTLKGNTGIRTIFEE